MRSFGDRPRQPTVTAANEKGSLSWMDREPSQGPWTPADQTAAKTSRWGSRFLLGSCRRCRRRRSFGRVRTRDGSRRAMLYGIIRVGRWVWSHCGWLSNRRLICWQRWRRLNLLNWRLDYSPVVRRNVGRVIHLICNNARLRRGVTGVRLCVVIRSRIIRKAGAVPVTRVVPIVIGVTGVVGRRPARSGNAAAAAMAGIGAPASGDDSKSQSEQNEW